jgi:hypothetical protein
LFSARVGEAEVAIRQNWVLAGQLIDQAAGWIPNDDAKELWKKKSEAIDAEKDKQIKAIEDGTEKLDILRQTNARGDGIGRVNFWAIKEKLDTLKRIAMEKDLLPLE